MTRCYCRRHDGSVTDKTHVVGVDVEDPVEAAAACRGCQPLHAIDPTPPTPFMFCADDPPEWERENGEGDT